MNIFFHQLFISFLIFAINSSIIINDAVHPDERLLKIVLQDIQKTVDSSYPQNYSGAKIIVKTTCTPYDFKTKKPEICIQKNLENDYAIEMRNAMQKFELSFSNIDLKNLKSEITINEYFQDFLALSQELATDPLSIQESIKKGIEVGLTKAITSDMIVNIDAKTCQFEYTYSGLKNKVTCSIVGETVIFETEFFNIVIELSIPEKVIISHEIETTILETVKHLNTVKKFELSDGAGSAQSFKKTSCKLIFESDEIKNHLSKRLESYGLKFSLEKAEDNLAEIKIADETRFVTIKCSTSDVSNFATLVLSVSFANLDSAIVSEDQTILKESMYDTGLLGKSFVDYYASVVIRMMGNGEKVAETRIAVTDDKNNENEDQK